MLARRELAWQQLQLFIHGEKSPTRILDTRHILVSILPSAHPVFPVSVSSSLSFPTSPHTADRPLRLSLFPILLEHSPSLYLRSSSLATPTNAYQFLLRFLEMSLLDVAPAILQSLPLSLRSIRSNSPAVHRLSCCLLQVASLLILPLFPKFRTTPAKYRWLAFLYFVFYN